MVCLSNKLRITPSILIKIHVLLKLLKMKLNIKMTYPIYIHTYMVLNRKSQINLLIY
jgi:hypothetical protein